MHLTDAIQHINLALNYPALTYEDISLYFDMAIAELNTTLHTSIPTVSDMVKEYLHEMSKESSENTVTMYPDPALNNYDIAIDPERPTIGNPRYYYDTRANMFYAWNNTKNRYDTHPYLIGIYVRDGVPEKYLSVFINNASGAYWVLKNDAVKDCDLSEYLPDEWVLLWLIPYVCFKYTVRDGGTAQTFAEELSQGFQQLQETYNVPSKVILATYADRLAYKKLVEVSLPNLNIVVRTKAIYEDMKHSRVLNAEYGSMFDRGGF